MLFHEAKTKMEFGLQVLGLGERKYTMVTEKEWVERSDDCSTTPHRMDDVGIVCGACKIFFIKEEALPDIDDSKLLASVNFMAENFQKGILK